MANEYGIGTWGQNAWNENSDVNISVTGLQLNSSLGDETITTEINTGWGRLTWGAQDWGGVGISTQVGVSGQQLNTNLGTAVSAAETFASVTGNGLTVEEGILDPRPDVILEGQQLNINLGQPIILADANLSVTGIGLTVDEGNATLDANTISLQAMIYL